MSISLITWFKNERHIAKIEVTRGDNELLKDKVNGVVALVTENKISYDNVFRPDQPQNIADFIIQQYIDNDTQAETEAILFVNGKKVPMKGFVQDALAGTIQGFITSLKKAENPQSIEIRIKINNEKH